MGSVRRAPTRREKLPRAMPRRGAARRFPLSRENKQKSGDLSSTRRLSGGIATASCRIIRGANSVTPRTSVNILHGSASCTKQGACTTKIVSGPDRNARGSARAAAPRRFGRLYDIIKGIAREKERERERVRSGRSNGRMDGWTYVRTDQV